MNEVTSFLSLIPSSMHLRGFKCGMYESSPTLQSAMVYLPAFTKAIASLIIDEISLFLTSVLIYCPNLTRVSMSAMQDLKSPSVGSLNPLVDDPQSVMATFTSPITVSISEISPEIPLPDLASEMNYFTSFATWTPSLMHLSGLKCGNGIARVSSDPILQSATACLPAV